MAVNTFLRIDATFAAVAGTDLDASFFEGWLGGLNLSNDGTTPNTVLDISNGVCVDSTNTVWIKLGAFTKSTGGAWVAGTGNNGMGTGLTIANTTWYHVFAIINNGAADIYFDISVTAGNKPANTTAFRRIGSFKTDASAHIRTFVQLGDEFLWNTPTLDISNPTVTTTPSLVAVSTPLGLKTNALIRGFFTNATNPLTFLMSSPDEAGNAGVPGGNATVVVLNAGVVGTFSVNIRTNTASQVQLSSNVTVAGNTMSATAIGWVDTRGRFN